jgi:hypothetical protein
MTNHDHDFMRVLKNAQPKSAADSDGVKAVVYAPEGAEMDESLGIEVVGLNAATMAAMVARRC